MKSLGVRRIISSNNGERTDRALGLLTAVVLILPAADRWLPAQEGALARSVPSDRSVVSARVVAEARNMIAEFKTTRYSHKTHVDQQRGICEVDCSGFLVLVFKKAAPEHLRLIETSHKRPLAEDFYRAISANRQDSPHAWTRIERAEDARPGDIIAWLKVDRQPGDNTGHVMLIAERPIVESRHRVRVRVLDSTSRGHGQDTRPEGTSGIGEGTIWVDLDAEGRPVGYRWKSRRGIRHEAPIVIGRALTIRK